MKEKERERERRRPFWRQGCLISHISPNLLFVFFPFPFFFGGWRRGGSGLMWKGRMCIEGGTTDGKMERRLRSERLWNFYHRLRRLRARACSMSRGKQPASSFFIVRNGFRKVNRGTKGLADLSHGFVQENHKPNSYHYFLIVYLSKNVLSCSGEFSVGTNLV